MFFAVRLGIAWVTGPQRARQGETAMACLRAVLIGLILGGLSANLGEAELDFLRTLGDRAALALHNARLYANIRRSAERARSTDVGKLVERKLFEDLAFRAVLQ